ncbi:MAG: IS1634 family transposase [Burkholderiales bacterium]|nr:IS1634 family transposase [Metallibacterium scheffleri]NNM65402.1 IS1634 family transposase [Burkholderiales bacterium]
MFVKLTRSGPRSYVKLVEAYRDDRGVSRQRVVATLGRLEQVRTGGADALIRGLHRVIDGEEPQAPSVRFAPALAVGDTWMLHALWHKLGWDEAFRRVLRNAHGAFDAERLLRVMVFNRLCDATSKLGVLRWLEGTRVPGVDSTSVTHQRLLRTMDTLAERSEAMQRTLAAVLRPLVDQDLSIVFYDMTTIGMEGQSEVPGEIRQFGLSKDGGIRRQVMLGVVQTAEGLPIAHRVWAGNTAEAPTLHAVIDEILALYPVKRVVLVADRGLLSLDNLEWLQTVRIGKTAQPLEFILAVPGRRYGEFNEILGAVQAEHCVQAKDEVIGETSWQGLRLVWAHEPQAAAQQSAARRQTIETLTQQAELRAGKLDAQDAGAAFKGRRLSDSGAKAWLFRAVSDAHLGSIIKVDLQSDRFAYTEDEAALKRAELNDGKLLLVTNTTDLDPAEVIARYKSLADIERGFRVLKSEIEIAPVFHRLPDRIRAHALICFMALVLYRVLRMQLKSTGSYYSPERALEIARRIQLHQVRIAGQGAASGLTDLSPEQLALFDQLQLDIPTREPFDIAP